ncbi:MAG TPA: DUF4157 domain-containing protein [Kofleriaceae bacterium]|jgi:hypothetical protein
MQTAAMRGVAHAAQPLPHLDRIQQAFGEHDVGHVSSIVGGEGADAANQMGARAYTAGDKIAFREQPDLRLAAHEAAHVVQQRGDIQLKDGVGRPGDAYEQHADAIADAVVAGNSAEHLLGEPKGTTGPMARRGPIVQKKDELSQLPARLRVADADLQFPEATVGETSMATLWVANDGTALVNVAELWCPGGQFSLLAARILQPGATAELQVEFRPRSAGAIEDTLLLLDETGAELVNVGASGLGLPVFVPPASEAAANARNQALKALSDWATVSQAALAETYAVLHANWQHYLTLTEGNPQIPRALVPDDAVAQTLAERQFQPLLGPDARAPGASSFGRLYASTVIGDAVSVTDAAYGIGHYVKRAGKYFTAKKIAKGTAALGTDLVAAEAGFSLGGPVGAVVAFAVAALIESFCGLFFDAIFGTPDASKEIRAAYFQGRSDASVAIDTSFRALDPILEQRRGDAQHGLADQIATMYARIAATADETQSDNLAKEAGELLADTKRRLADQQKEDASEPFALANSLFELWARAHAGSPGIVDRSQYDAGGPASDDHWRGSGDVVTPEWWNVVQQLAPKDRDHFRWYGMVNQPALFLYQTLTDWDRLGLAGADEQIGALFAELGEIPGVGEAPQTADKRSQDARRAFEQREYTWTNLDNTWGQNDAFFAGLPDQMFGPGPRRIDSATCKLRLNTTESTCYVMEWVWTLRLRSQHVQVEVSRNPNSPEWTDNLHRYSWQYYRGPVADYVMDNLRARGVRVEEEGPRQMGESSTSRFLHVLDLVPDYQPPPYGTNPRRSDELGLGGRSTSDVDPQYPSLGEFLSGNGIFPEVNVEVIARDDRHIYLRAEETLVMLDYYYYTGPR